MPEKKKASIMDTVLGTLRPVLATTKTKIMVQLFRAFVIAKENELREELGVSPKKNLVKTMTRIFREYMEEVGEENEDEDEDEDEDEEKKEGGDTAGKGA